LSQAVLIRCRETVRTLYNFSALSQ